MLVHLHIKDARFLGDSNYNAKVMECLHLSVLMAFSVEGLQANPLLGIPLLLMYMYGKKFFAQQTN